MQDKDEALNLLLIFGGRSCEHAVSVSSARSLIGAISSVPYRFQFIGITEQGQWRWSEGAIDSLLEGGKVDPVAGIPVSPDLNHPGRFIDTQTGRELAYRAEVIFPLLHGPYGEDGTIQGLLELFGVPYVGCSVLASACGMDKLISKQLFARADIPQADYVEVRREKWHADTEAVRLSILQSLRFPLFVKPANMGSSVGISKVEDAAGLDGAIKTALEYDHKVLVENGFENVLEVECAVLGDEQPRASLVGEIRPGAAFYDYAAKYIDDGSSVIIPAEISDAAAQKVRELAIRAFQALDGSGLARVDFFVDTQTDGVWINEINTLPGFTPISMYPKLWEASGLAYADLVDKLIAHAKARFRRKQVLNCCLTAP